MIVYMCRHHGSEMYALVVLLVLQGKQIWVNEYAHQCNE